MYVKPILFRFFYKGVTNNQLSNLSENLKIINNINSSTLKFVLQK